jgi:hypothetical protein
LHTTDAEIIRCIEVLDRRKQQGQRTDLASIEAKSEASGKSAQETAKLMGTSRAKVERARTVLYHGGEIKQKVLDGKVSIHREEASKTTCAISLKLLK